MTTKISDWATKPYYSYNREERNYCALLYGFLMDEDYLAEFLNRVSESIEDPNKKELIKNWKLLGTPHVYFEYAKLRDLWYRAEDITQLKKQEFICKQLELKDDFEELNKSGFKEFNKNFKSKSQTEKVVASPQTWNFKQYNKFTDKDLVMKVALLNWSFNAKADIVIEFVNDENLLTHALCFEAKLDSHESRYLKGDILNAYKASNSMRKAYPTGIGQLSVQRNIFKILGCKSTHIFLAKATDSKKLKEKHLKLKKDHPQNPDTADGYLSWDKVFKTIQGKGFFASFAQTLLDKSI